MDLVTKKRLMLFAGSGNPELSEEIAANLKLPLGDIKLSRFANGELYCRYGESVRGADVFLLQSYCDPINDRIMEQLIMIDAAKRASAKRITVGLPVLRVRAPGPEGRGSRADHRAPRRRHAHGRRRRPRRHRRPAHRSDPGLLRLPGGPPHRGAAAREPHREGPRRRERRVTVVSPDAGGGKLARRFANCLEEHDIDADLAFIDKRRPKGTHNVAVAEEVVGEVAGPPVPARRRHHRHRGHRRERGRAAHQAGRRLGLDHGHPRPALRARRSTG